MDDTVIKVENISKRYRLGSGGPYKTIRESIVNIVKKALPPGKNNEQEPSGDVKSGELWALRDVSFEVKQGDIVGVIGRNGAGKSTLLKILARITEPTTGRITMKGRVGSLLEVGTGFHPELSGHENIYLYGAILGMDRYEVTRKFDEIIAFAELEKFVETPVKRYSSGMYMRLAFAVAAHLEPEILLVDEVLAVGDVQFQKKCIGKMGEVSKSGRTVLFVSHNMQAVKTLCSSGIYLENGAVKSIDTIENIVNLYMRDILPSQESILRVWDDFHSAPGNDKIRIHRMEIVPDGSMAIPVLHMNSSFSVLIDFWNCIENQGVIISMSFYGLDDTPAFQSLSVNEMDWKVPALPQGLFRSVCRIPAHLMNEGIYKIRILFIDANTSHLFDFRDALILTIHNIEQRELPWYGKFIGSVYPKLDWSTTILNNTGTKF
jgi:lipopolysaccharide transport system ATP-binding protein